MCIRDSRKIEWPALRRDQLQSGELPQAVFVEFDDRSIRGNTCLLYTSTPQEKIHTLKDQVKGWPHDISMERN